MILEKVSVGCRRFGDDSFKNGLDVDSIHGRDFDKLFMKMAQRADSCRYALRVIRWNFFGIHSAQT
jgi:hypothetical protein